MTSTTAGDDPLDFNEKRTVSAESTGSEEDNNELITPPPTYDWENDKRKSELFDDGTMSFFWRAHTLTVLTISMAILFYVAVFEKETLDSSYNAKRGLLACSMFFLLFGVVITPDGPFIRPHPALWRLVLCSSVLYELLLIYILFQNVDDARRLLAHIDPELGKPLPDKDYGGSCRIYDWENSTDPFYSFRDKMDGFVLSHFIGWWLKTLILRDFWLCWVTSVGFEVLEYSLEHQLPNFSECWWDHWILDALICNGGGIYLGMKTCEYLKMKPYNWRGLWKIPTVRGKIMRVLGQFTPHDWLEFSWRPQSSLKRWGGMLCIIIMLFLAELGTFYLKFILWIPPPHLLCVGRLLFFLLAGSVAMRELFEYMDNPECKTVGRQLWVMSAMLITEILIIFKFGWHIVSKPLPFHISILWLSITIVVLLWTIYQFWFKNLIYWHWHRLNIPVIQLQSTIKSELSENHVSSENSALRHRNIL